VKAKTVKAKSEPPAPAPYRTEVDEQRLDAAVSWIEARFPGNPRESTARAVAHVYRSIVVLVGEPFLGRVPDPERFRLPVEAIAKKARDLSPSRPKPRFIDPAEIQACVDALVAAGALMLVAPGDATAQTPKARGPVLALPRIEAPPEAATS
jgi:hypothetical protein